MVRPLVCYDCGRYLSWNSATAIRLNSKVYYLCHECYYYSLPRAMRNPIYEVTVTKGTIKPRGGVEVPFTRIFTVRAKTAKSAVRAVRDAGIPADKVEVKKVGNPKYPI